MGQKSILESQKNLQYDSINPPKAPPGPTLVFYKGKQVWQVEERVKINETTHKRPTLSKYDFDSLVFDTMPFCWVTLLRPPV